MRKTHRESLPNALSSFPFFTRDLAGADGEEQTRHRRMCGTPRATSQGRDDEIQRCIEQKRSHGGMNVPSPCLRQVSLIGGSMPVSFEAPSIFAIDVMDRANTNFASSFFLPIIAG